MASLGLYLADMAAWPLAPDGTASGWPPTTGSAGGCSTCCGASGPLPAARHPRQRRAAVGVDGLDERSQRHADARVPRVPRRDRRRRASGSAAPVGPGRAGLPGRRCAWSSRPTRRTPIRDEQRLRALGVARPQVVGDAGAPVEVEGTAGVWRVDPEATRRRLRRAHRAAVAVRPADPRPGPRDRAVRLRVHARDVQAEGRSGAGGTSRCPCCTTTGSSARSTPPADRAASRLHVHRRAPRRALHPRHDHRRRRRAAGAGRPGSGWKGSVAG